MKPPGDKRLVVVKGWGWSEEEWLSLTLDSEGQEVKRGGGGLRQVT